MKSIFNKIALMSLCLLATNHAAADSKAIKTGVEVAHTHDSINNLETKPHHPMTETNIKLDEVLVTSFGGNRQIRQSPAPVTVVSHRQLEMQPSSNLIDAIAHLPGVAQVTTGTGISKPIVRGLGFNRVLVVNDGVRQEGQQWGDEHGVEIDQHTVHSVEIIKGPASLRYGSDAMAGAIVFHSAPTLLEGEMKANVFSGYQTNNGLWDYSLCMQGNQKGFVWNSRYSGKFAHDYTNRHDGYVCGSRYKEQNLSQMLGINGIWGYSHLLLSCYHLTPGIIEGREEGDKSYAKTVPFQQIHHYKAVLDNSFRMGEGTLKTSIGYQRNHRQEFEESLDECALALVLHTVTYDVHYDWAQTMGWQFSVGMNGMYQKSENRGTEFLIPDYHLSDYGLFAMASKQMGKWNLSGGLRHDLRLLHSNALVEEGQQRFNAFRRDLRGLSGSLGFTCEIANGLNVKLNLSHGFRAPSISELGANGVHEGAQLYQKGNEHLKPEQSWQLDFGMDYSSNVVYAQIALFTNRIGNYIFNERMAGEDGNPVFMENVPVYQYTSGDARILGGEVSVDVHPMPRLHVCNSFAYVNTMQLHRSREAKYLPLTPAPRWNADVKYEFICGGRSFDNLFVKLAMECNLRQNRFYAVNNTETATPSYTLFHLYAGTDVCRRGKRLFSLYISGENLFDRAYQNHLSRLKNLGLNPTTGRQGVYNMGRNFSIRFVIPIKLGK